MDNLTRLGLDTSDANIYFPSIKSVEGPDGSTIDETSSGKSYTLGNILEHLPKSIKGAEPNWNCDEWHIDAPCLKRLEFIHKWWDGQRFRSEMLHCENFDIKGAYGMLCWCLENKFVEVKDK